MPTPLRLLLVEDEFVSLDMLRDVVLDMGYHLAGDAMTINEAKQVLETEAVDLALLDINMEQPGDGIELGRFIRLTYDIPFLYLTAYSDGPTIRAAAKTEPYGYLIKPFSAADIYAALEVALARREAERRPNGSIDLYLRDGDKFFRVAAHEIYYVQAFRNYLEIHAGSETYLFRSTLKQFSKRLPAELFIQPHRSYLVNAQRVRKFNGTELEIGLARIPVSRTGREVVRDYYASR